MKYLTLEIDFSEEGEKESPQSIDIGESIHLAAGETKKVEMTFTIKQ